ncbi:ACT domain-containing protein, partial [Candidatus Aerophobetes bacterium]|nr:ACT domain-containing protein [Candidatus Aerophobetes bacterium]
MLVKQISVFLENKIGRLAEICDLLGKNNINIRALAIADTTEFGILRLIVDDPEKAQQILEKQGITAK